VRQIVSNITLKYSNVILARAAFGDITHKDRLVYMTLKKVFEIPYSGRGFYFPELPLIPCSIDRLLLLAEE
jgi:hypothetical protein